MNDVAMEKLMIERVAIIHEMGFPETLTLWCNWYEEFNCGEGGFTWNCFFNRHEKLNNITAETWPALLRKLSEYLGSQENNVVLREQLLSL